MHVKPPGQLARAAFSLPCCIAAADGSQPLLPTLPALACCRHPAALQKFNRWLDGELSQGPQNSLLVYPEGTRRWG